MSRSPHGKLLVAALLSMAVAGCGASRSAEVHDTVPAEAPAPSGAYGEGEAMGEAGAFGEADAGPDMLGDEALAWQAAGEPERPSLQATPDPAIPQSGGGAMVAPVDDAAPVGAGTGGRMIIKDAVMSLEVDSVELGISRIDGIAAQSGGYVLETRTDFSNPFWKQAFVRISVPSDRFETALERIRQASLEVISEEASGVDVSQEYVDVQSQIANLEATQARVREFLAQAQTVEEALEVNAELSRIEGELGRLKGRLQYLEQRSAYSTIAVQMREPEPDPTATPTPSVTPTPSATPTPTPRPPWQPSQTAGRALSSLRTALELIGNAAIWLALVVVPVLLVLAVPLVLLVVVVRGLRRRGE